MARRILGALLITRALAPLIVLVVLVLTSLITVSAIRQATATYRTRVQAEIDRAGQAFARADSGLAALGTYVTAVRGAVGGVAGAVANLAEEITVPLPQGWPQLPALDIPGVPQFKQVVAGVAAAGRALGAQIDKVTALGTVPAQLADVRTATNQFAGAVRSAVVRWIVIVLGALSLAVVAWLLASLARTADEVRRGWALLRGIAPPAEAVADLTRQVADLRRQVAALQAARA